MSKVDDLERLARAIVEQAYTLCRPSEPDAYTVEQFSRRHSISPSTFYEMKRKGEGPRIFKVGTSPRVSREAAADWRRAREAAELAHSGGPAVCS